MKKDDRKAKADMVIKRYGKTLGDSKGTAPLPKPKITVRPTGGLKLDGFTVKYTKKF